MLTGGLVDVKNAQKTTSEQPNLHFAAAYSETLEETQGKMQVEEGTLELFGKETVKIEKSYRLFDAIIYTGKFKNAEGKNTQIKDTFDTNEACQETTEPLLVDMGKLIEHVLKECSKVKRKLAADSINNSTIVHIIEEEIRKAPAIQAYEQGKISALSKPKAEKTNEQKKVSALPKTKEEWNTNGEYGEVQWKDYFNSIRIQMFAQFTMVNYRQELGLDKARE